MEGNNLKIRPLFDNVVVRKDELEEKSKTGIIITGSDDQPALVGTVLTVGRDVEDQIKPGDKIMYAPFSGRELGGFLLLAQHDIMGVVIEEEYHSKSEQRRVETLKAPKRPKAKCTKCGTEGYPKNGDACPNCGGQTFIEYLSVINVEQKNLV
jgi:chaperonin GroES